MSMIPEPIDLNTSAADAGRKATKKMRNATPPQVRTFLTIPGFLLFGRAARAVRASLGRP
jgi:hypothetical protein